MLESQGETRPFAAAGLAEAQEVPRGVQGREPEAASALPAELRW